MRANEQRFGISERKEVNFSEWYAQVLEKGDMHDYYNVRGFSVMRPQAMFIWNEIRKEFTRIIEKMGVKECYFPMVVTKEAIEKEKRHVLNFSPELAWITRCGEDDLSSPVAVRPTSETIMYPHFSNWIRSHRDLPLKLNQWCNVLRWEVKNTIPFVRGREFLWQEGHTAHLTSEEAEDEAKKIMDVYETNIYKDLLAVPTIRGRKSESEKFGGADYSLSIECFIPESGKGIQASTSHFLGSNFSRIFGISVESQAETCSGPSFVFQTSWGITTRSIGIVAMIHSDNIGLVLPPRVAVNQVVVVPCGISVRSSKDDIGRMFTYIRLAVDELVSSGVRAHFDDDRTNSPGYKFNFWELRGIPIRAEVGFKEVDGGYITLVRRVDGVKESVKRENLVTAVKGMLENIHECLYERAKEKLERSVCCASNLDELKGIVNAKRIARVVWCTKVECEECIFRVTAEKDSDGNVVRTGARSLCVLEENAEPGSICAICGDHALGVAVFGRTY